MLNSKKITYALKKIILALFLFILFFSSAFAGQNQKITVAGDRNFPPYEFVDSSGNFQGFNIDIMSTISIYTGLQVEYIPMEWADALKALEDGKVDALLGMSKSEERDKKYDFSRPILVNSRVILVSRENKDINSLTDLKGKKVAIQKGDIAEEIVRNIEGINILRGSSQEEALFFLMDGQADAFIGNKYTARYFLKKYNLENRVKVVGDPISETLYCMAVKEGNTELLNIFNYGLNQMVEDGIYDKIIKKWFGEEPYDVKAAIKKHFYTMVVISIFVLSIIFLLLYINKKLKGIIDRRTSEIRKANEELSAAYEEIYAQNEELAASFEELRMTGQRIKELQERLMLALEASETCVWEYDIESRRFYITENAAKLIKGCEVVCGYRTVLKSLEKKDRRMLLDAIRKAYTGKTKEIEVKVRARDLEGKRRYLLIHGKYVDEKFTGVISDITELENYRRMLEFELERYKALFRNSRDGIVFYDSNRVFREVNPAFERIFGYSRDEIIGKSIFDETVIKRFMFDINRAQKILKGEEFFLSYEGVRYKKDGTPVIAKMKDIVVSDKNGEILGAFSFYEDITEEKRYLEQLRALFNHSPDAIVLLDKDHRIVDVNPAFEKLFEYSKEECLGKDVDELINKEEELENAKKLTQMVFNDEKHSVEGVRYTKNGKPIYVNIRGILIKVNEEIIGIYGIYTDITEIHEYRTKLEYISLHDNLTGLYNRAFFEEELLRYTGSREYPISIIMMDLNGLKLINDSLGHDMGDKLLIKFSEVLLRSIRSSDILARIGGDEFALLLPRTSNSDAEKIVSRIKDNIEKFNEQESQEGLYLSLSIGYATAENEGENLKDVLKRADELMYRDKLLNSISIRKQTLNVLMSILAEKDYINEGHAQRVKDLSLKIGKKLGLSPKELSDLALLAKVHDIGKIAISDSILNKKGPLTEEEWEVLKQHSQKGYRIALSSPDLAGIAEFILKHHERWDGKGYPLGLKGKEIPLLCRILSVAEAFDAMTSRRPYSEQKSVEEALLEIKRNAGTQFDPEIVEIFLSLFDEELGEE